MAQPPTEQQSLAAIEAAKEFKPEIPSNEEIVNRTQRVAEHGEINGTVKGYPTANPVKGRLIYPSQTISNRGVQSMLSGPGGFTYLVKPEGSFDTTVSSGYEGTFLNYTSEGTTADVKKNDVKNVGRNKVGSVKRK